MATILRGPSVTLIPPAKSPRPAMQSQPVLNPLLAQLASQDKLPFGLYDWPVPQRAVPPIPRFQWTQPTPFWLAQVAADLPFDQTEWPIPGAKPYPVELRTFLGAPNLNLSGKDALPVQQSDWPIPRGKPWFQTNVYPRPAFGKDQFFGGQGQPPTYPADPIPQGKPFPLELRFWANGNGIVPLQLAQQPAPFYSRDWTIPTGKPYPISFRTHVSYYVIDDSAPFKQTEWPLPTGKPYPISLRTFTGAGPLYTPAIPAPGQFDWPIPLAKPSLRELRTYLWPPQTQLVQRAADTPFVQTEWPIPHAKAALRELRTFIGTGPLFIPVAPPPNQSDWPIPLGKPYPISLRTSLQSVSLLLKDTIYGAPGQGVPLYDWPIPMGKPYPIGLRSYFNNLMESTLSPIPATVLVRRTMLRSTGARSDEDNG
jgi:hypothetical protein